jgi:hypothetical protein
MKKQQKAVLIGAILLIGFLLFFTDFLMIQPACDYTIETNADVVGNRLIINMFGSQADYQPNSRVCWAVNYDAQSISFNDMPEWDCKTCYEPHEQESIGYINCEFSTSPISSDECGRTGVNSDYEVIGYSTSSSYCQCLIEHNCASNQAGKCVAHSDKVKEWQPYTYFGKVNVNNILDTGVKYYEGTNIFYIDMGNCPVETTGDCALNYNGKIEFEGDFGFIEEPDFEIPPFPPSEPEDITIYFLIGIAIIGGIAIIYFLFK